MTSAAKAGVFRSSKRTSHSTSRAGRLVVWTVTSTAAAAYAAWEMNEMTTDHETKLTIGTRYDVDGLRLVRWTAPDSGDYSDEECTYDGYSVFDYFRDGEYIGPDEYGVEPIFSADSIKNAQQKSEVA